MAKQCIKITTSRLGNDFAYAVWCYPPDSASPGRMFTLLGKEALFGFFESHKVPVQIWETALAETINKRKDPQDTSYTFCFEEELG